MSNCRSGKRLLGAGLVSEVFRDWFLAFVFIVWSVGFVGQFISGFMVDRTIRG